MFAPSALKKLQTILGPADVLTSQEDRISYSYDGTPMLSRLPEAVLRPRTADQIAAIVQLANEEEFAIVPRGSGSGLSGGSVPVENCVVMLTNHWTRILEIDERNLTAWVEPGVITAQFHSAVEGRGLFYPPDPGSAAVCTLGGNVAENAGGLRGLKYGVTKNYVLGLEVVLPTGEIMTVGGKSVKDVAGYNLRDVLVGSEGTLGIFTKILLRLIPKPESSSTMLVMYDRLTDAAETVSSIIAARISPAALEFLDNTTIRCVEEFAHLGLPTNIEALLLIEVDGRGSVVEEDASMIEKICRDHGAREVRRARDDGEAARLRSARKIAFSALARVKPTTILEDVTVPRSEVALMLDRIQEISRKYGLMWGNFGHAGDGNLHPTCLTDERDHAEVHKAEKAFDEVFSAAVKLGGTITGEHGTGLAKRAFLDRLTDPPALQMMRSLKDVMDPRRVLNPGKIFELKPRCEGPMPRRREQIEKFLAQGAFT
ncbi:MAG: glycolate oxidase subunit GlcD [Ignavibacteria bacterium RIFCSPHIGHO2_02_FULL_56_12]|nr:MAG: glycolate oxidase subunit GlcD [Ignavibacteria bacterium RIFCSPHIGHO2_02_FULL_56_12]